MFKILRKIKNLTFYLIVRLYIYDMVNIIKNGTSAPRYYDLILINPLEVSYYLRLEDSGLKNLEANVYPFSYHKNDVILVEKLPKVKAIADRYSKNIDWEETELFQKHKKDSYRFGDKIESYEEFLERYERIDKIFAQIKEYQRFKIPSELKNEKRLNFELRKRIKKGFRGQDYPKIHIDQDCNLLFGGYGHHRLGIARFLKIALPCRIGVVHPSAIDCFNNYKKLYKEHESRVKKATQK